MSTRFPPLTPDLLVWAYSRGLFPMARGPRGPIDWYDPDPRAILPLDAFHVPHGLRRTLRRGRFELRLDCDFPAVIRACAAPRRYEQGTWINRDIMAAYTRLHELGLAHCIEAWGPASLRGGGAAAAAGTAAPTPGGGDQPVLLGGLYGVALGGAFFGESMFSRATDASKVCLVRLVEHLRARGFVLLDTQIANQHMAQFGMVTVPRDRYHALLREAVALAVSW